MYDVAVIGAGVVGAMIARELTKLGASVCILEKESDVAMGATRANSAIVHAGFDAKEGSLKARLNVRGSQMMEKVAEELGVKYKNNGSLVIGFSDEDRKMIEELKVRGDKNGVPGLCILEGEALFEKEPNLSENVTCALYAPTGAIICPYELTVAAIGNAMDNGAELKTEFKVSEISKNDEGYIIKSENQEVEARFLVNAAGVFSDEIAKMVGDDTFSITPRRGEYILLDKTCGNLATHTIFRTPSKMGKGILVSPTVDGNLLTGPTSVDIEDKNDTRTTEEGIELVIKEARENLKNVPFGKTITSFCGLRATGSTGDFIINAPKPGFINVAGIESPGLSASPAIAEYVLELLEKEGFVKKENPDFNPKREATHTFSHLSNDEKNEIIKKNPAYGKIICRCEGITEGEILDAIHRNPKATTLDAVKRRTRSGMGRCQGGFCSPQIVEILSRELGIAYEKVTKSGGNSYINIGRTKEGV